jgi:hypothetical protein
VIDDGQRDGACFWAFHDLDQNGFVDFILLSGNAGSGPEGLTVTIVTFDSEGRPIPWHATGAFDLRGDGISDLQRNRITGEVRLRRPLIIRDEELWPKAVMHQTYSLRDHYWVKRNFGQESTLPIEQQVPKNDLGQEDLSNGPTDAAWGQTTLRRGSRTGCTPGIGAKLIDGTVVLQPKTPNCSDEEDAVIEIIDRKDGTRFAAVDAGFPPEIGDKGLRVMWQWVGRSCYDDCRPFVAWYREAQ